jgi:hypothetical protein
VASHSFVIQEPEKHIKRTGTPHVTECENKHLSRVSVSTVRRPPSYLIEGGIVRNNFERICDRPTKLIVLGAFELPQENRDSRRALPT